MTDGTRTRDNLNHNQVIYQLIYGHQNEGLRTLVATVPTRKPRAKIARYGGIVGPGATGAPPPGGGAPGTPGVAEGPNVVRSWKR